MQTIIVIWLLLGIINTIRVFLSSWFEDFYDDVKLRVKLAVGFYSPWFDFIILAVLIIVGPWSLLREFIRLFRK